MVLIESDWNLKEYAVARTKGGQARINRIRLEFKVRMDSLVNIFQLRINRIRLEFKAG